MGYVGTGHDRYFSRAGRPSEASNGRAEIFFLPYPSKCGMFFTRLALIFSTRATDDGSQDHGRRSAKRPWVARGRASR